MKAKMTSLRLPLPAVLRSNRKTSTPQTVNRKPQQLTRATHTQIIDFIPTAMVDRYLAEAMPAQKYSFAPDHGRNSRTLRTFAQQLKEYCC